MKLQNWFVLAVLFSSLCLAKNSITYEKQKNCIILKLEKQKNTDPLWMKIQICREDIFRIIATPVDTFLTRPSLMVDKQEWQEIPFDVKENINELEISASNEVSVKRLKNYLWRTENKSLYI